ncbi:hypothetical protein NBC122_00564 [Chryseobacterium salivictor]|uniref:Transposase, Mutator family n=2 Tax=Chryseobacterium salivictor TaxID=2547600 RepID=A0A4P6ZD27_9FLAO|nr:hypothetical protein NBC122_00564 [Chryseobacterium salivictor]
MCKVKSCIFKLQQINVQTYELYTEQISDLLLNVANSENGSNLLMQLTLNAFMKSERHLHQQENEGDYGNGYRERKARGFGKEMILKVPRTRHETSFLTQSFI